MKRVLKWGGISLLVLLLISAFALKQQIDKFNTQNFVADKSTPDYADRVVKLWPDGQIPRYKDPQFSPDDIAFPYSLISDAEAEYSLIPNMLTYPIMDGAPKAAVMIYPGGGYLIRSEKHEGIKIARFLNDHGIAAFVVNYRLSPYRQPVPLMDAVQALALVRANADTYNVDPNRVGVLGFSAGGNLAALVSNNAEPRPAFAVLGYGTIAPFTTKEPTAATAYFTDDQGNPVTVTADVSPETMINDQTPPSFIFHTKDDTVVKVIQSTTYYDLLIKQGIPAAIHLFDHGGHGIGLAEDIDGAKDWPYLLVDWLVEQGITPAP